MGENMWRPSAWLPGSLTACNCLCVLGCRRLQLVGGSLGDVFGDLLPVLERLLADFSSVLLDFVGGRAHALVFDARGRQQHADQEACRDGADGQSKRVLLGDSHGIACPLRYLPAIGRRVLYR